MFNDLPTNNTKDDVKDVKPESTHKKGLLQSLHSLTFSDDSDDDAVVPATVKEDTPVVNVTNMASPSMGPSIGPSVPMPKPLNNPVSPTPTPAMNNSSVDSKPLSGPTPFTPEAKPSTVSSPLYDQRPSTPAMNTNTNVSSPVSNTSSNSNNVKKDVSYNLNDLADLTVTFDTIEDSLAQEMRKSIDSVKSSAQNIKDKANYELLTSFGLSSKEVVVFNTFLTKEMAYTSKTGKAGTQRVNFFGIMTEKGVYAIRVSSALTSKLEDALKHTSEMRDDTVGLLGEGTSRRFVLKLPAEDYGSNNVLYVPLVGELSKQNPETFTGLDAVEVDMAFIEDMMGLAVNEVDAMLDYEKRRRANLKALQDKTGVELKKASIISDKLSSLSL